jgi:hypothetical protein
MLRLTPIQSRAAALFRSGPPLIIAGLGALILVMAIPTIPAITALSILMLGATNATLDRFRNSPSIVSALVLHTTTYCGLYALFVGATLNLVMTTHGGTLGVIAADDLTMSVIPMVVSLHRIAIALKQQFEPQR